MHREFSNPKRSKHSAETRSSVFVVTVYCCDVTEPVIELIEIRQAKGYSSHALLTQIANINNSTIPNSDALCPLVLFVASIYVSSGA